MSKKKKIIFIIIFLLICILPIATRQLSPTFVLNNILASQAPLSIMTKNSITKKFTDKELLPYLQYVKKNALEPSDYIVKKFHEKDLVIMSENHWLESHTRFVEELIDPLVKAGVRDFAFEFGNIQCQKLMDDFLNKPEPDMKLLYTSLSEVYDIFGWPYSGYVKIFLKLHQVNQNLKKQGDSLFIHLTDAPLRVNYSRNGWFRDRHMAKVLSGLLKQNKKVLFYCGATHGITGISSKKKGINFPTTGSLLHDEFKDRVFSVKLHNRFGGNILTYEKLAFSNGLFDEIIKRYKKTAGFDLVSSPFQNISGDSVKDALFLLSLDNKSVLTDAWQGYIFPNASNERKFCGVEEAMFRQYFVHKKLARDGFIVGAVTWLFLSPKQLFDACVIYKTRDGNFTEFVNSK